MLQETEPNPTLTEPLPCRDVDDVIGEIELNRYHGWLLLLCGIGFCVDAMEVVALSFINPCAGAEFNLTDSQIASITSCVFVGELLGSLFWGPFADVYGRYVCVYVCI
jgi:MFS family permease